MKVINNIFMLLALLACGSCSIDEDNLSASASCDEVCFTATLLENAVIETRALGAERGEEVALPYINGIQIKKVEESTEVVKPYHVKNGNKGTLEKGAKEDEVSTECIQWNDFVNAVDFYAWTAPAGVTINEDKKTGTVDFVVGNKGNETTVVSSINGTAVPPLEVFISAYQQAKYSVSPSVSLPFTHLVSKVSIRVRDWNNSSVSPTSITFLGIKDKWTIAQGADTKAALCITGANANANALTLQFSDLKISGGYYLIYLPPLVPAFGTNFDAAGEFCITYANNKYYGSLSTVYGVTNKELKAGEHLCLTMDLSENFGVGVGSRILSWQGPDGEEIIEGRPHQGVYSVEELKTVVYAVNKGTLASSDPSLFTKDKDGHKTIRLYNNLTLTDMLTIGTTSQPFKDLTFDGQGYTITLPATAAQGLFGVVGDDATSSTATTAIKNLCIAGGNVSGTDNVGILADTVRNTTIENCHVVSGSIAGASVGGLVGTADAGTTLTGCSVETTGAISGTTGTTVGALVGSLASGATISNCFVVSASAAGVSLVGGTAATGITYSYCWNRSGSPLNLSGSYWGASSESGPVKITFDPTDVFNTSVAVGSDTSALLLDALNTSGNASGNVWVYVYGKEYPVLKKE